MKTLKRLGFTAFTALALVLTACSGSDDGGGGSSLDTYISAKVDGVQFTTSSYQGQSVGIATRSGSGEFETIIVNCSNLTSPTATDFHSMSVALVGVSAPGTYEVNSSTNTTLGYIEATAATGNVSWDTGDYAGVSGTITVTTLTANKVEGTFSFTGAKDDECTNHKVVTNGSFRGTFAN
ncbi:MAG: DUF6252 family protein [Flavobacterium sp.]|nr:DUF6252 family protein [Flavobacterium sp.]